MVWIHREDNLHGMDPTDKVTDLEQTQLLDGGEARQGPKNAAKRNKGAALPAQL